LSKYGIADAGAAFFTLFATPPPGLEERAAALLQGYELLFWDTLAQASTLGT
jgi:hypothetical protein